MKLDARRVKITTVPLIEPVTLADAKLHLRIDHSTEDDVITRLIEMARLQAEDIAQRSLITRTFTAYADRWPPEVFELPFPPALTVASIKYTNEAGTQATFSSANYIVDVHSEPGRVALKAGIDWPDVTLQPINGVEIIYTAGYGAITTSVPDRYRQAILLLVGHLYENREAVLVAQGVNVSTLPLALDYLLLTDRGGWN